jgi:hypothetical protein
MNEVEAVRLPRAKYERPLAAVAIAFALGASPAARAQTPLPQIVDTPDTRNCGPSVTCSELGVAANKEQVRRQWRLVPEEIRADCVMKLHADQHAVTESQLDSCLLEAALNWMKQHPAQSPPRWMSCRDRGNC